MPNESFPLRFTYDNQSYTGMVRPSKVEKKNPVPLSYHVVLDGRSSGFFTCTDEGWQSTSETDQGLIDAVGSYIHLYCE